jgi:hypothetical protein
MAMPSVFSGPMELPQNVERVVAVINEVNAAPVGCYRKAEQSASAVA